jgi:hypothetical protein
MTLARTLKPAQSYVNAYRSDGKPYYLAPAVARVAEEARHVSIDLVNTLPEDGAEGAKYALGKVTLGVRRATPLGADPAANRSPIVSVGEIDNNRDAFVKYGGIYDLEVKDEAARLLADPDHEIVLYTERYGVLLYEPEFTIGSDCEAAYLDEVPPQSEVRLSAPQEGQGEPPVPQALRGSVPLHVRRRGRIPAEPVSLIVEQWRFTPSGDSKVFGAYVYPRKLGSEMLEVRGGFVEQELRPLDGPGVLMFRYVMPGQWQQDMDGGNLAKLTFQEDYTFLRVLPHDDEAAAAASSNGPIDYATIYKHVLRYYALILPAMAKRLQMSANSADLWTSPTAARYLLRTTSPDLWNHWAYMPRTRDLSTTRRNLLRQFCRQIIDAGAGSAAE